MTERNFYIYLPSKRPSMLVSWTDLQRKQISDLKSLAFVFCFKIPKGEETRLSKIFEVGQTTQEQYGCDYVVSQMTMDRNSYFCFLPKNQGMRQKIHLEDFLNTTCSSKES